MTIEIDHIIADGVGESWKAGTRSIEQGFDTLVAVGGEGTANEVVNSIYYSHQDIKLGFIKAGTVNDYLRTINWPDKLEEQVAKIDQGDSVKTPLTKAEGDRERVSLNVADTGIGAHIAYSASVERRLAWIRGDIRYQFLALRSIFKWKNMPASVTTDEDEFSGNLSMFMSGFSYTSGAYKILPHADPYGKSMAYLAAFDFSKRDMIRMMGVLKRGDQTEDINGVYLRTTNEAVIRSEDPVIFEVDGEPFSFDSREIVVTSLPKAISVIK